MAKKQNTNRISELRLNRRWSQGELAEKCGAHWVTISKLERGQMQLTQDWMERLAAVLDVHPTEILADPPTFRTVYVAGGIIDATNINPADILDEESLKIHQDGDTPVYMPFSLQFGAPEPDRTAWYIVDSEIFYPFIRQGDFVRFTYPAVFDRDLFTGRICMINMKYGKVRKLIGIPTNGSSEERFNIQVFGKEIISDADIEDIAYMSMVISNPEADMDEDGYPMP